MKTPLAALLLLTATAHAQNAGSAAAPASPAAAPASGNSSAAPVELVYPGTDVPTLQTDKAGILGIRGADIPRYTQTGPLPNPAPARHGVIAPVPRDPKLPTIWTIGDSTVRTGVNGAGEDQV